MEVYLMVLEILQRDEVPLNGLNLGAHVTHQMREVH